MHNIFGLYNCLIDCWLGNRFAPLAEKANKLFDKWKLSYVALTGLYFCEEIRMIEVCETHVSSEEDAPERTSRVELLRFESFSKIIKSYTNEGKNMKFFKRMCVFTYDIF